MYEQNYPSGQSAPTVDPEPAPNLTEGWLWRKAKITYDKGWYRLRDGELICQGSDRKKDEALGKVSGAVTTSEERLEFTLYTEFKTRSFCFRAESGKEFNRWMAACMLPENFV
mmetsp:Transcript_1611/g.3910  ORF Transcript_1611/g.3910 Transcript_1611/m.3910 type:complete len:113 (-) Transcript_1611:233-571(-)